MSDNSLVLSLPFILPAQAQKHVTHNEAVEMLDLLVQCSVKSRGLTEAPEAPGEGDRYIVASGATGDWAGEDHAIALWTGESEGWRFTDPQTGWRVYVEAAGAEVVWTGSAWTGLIDTVGSFQMLGIATTADSTNRLSVASDASLFSHAGSDHRIKVNKAATTATASLLFQNAWSGRAEMGLSGNDDFAIKISPDGSSWTVALRFDADTGLAEGAAVTQSKADATEGRLLKAGDAGILGTAYDAYANGLSDMDDLPSGVTCAIDAAMTGQPSSTGSGMAGAATTTEMWSAGNKVQRFRPYSPASARGRAFERSCLSGTWGDWSEVYSQLSALGTVAQSGGVPTGALIERGETTDGTYARFADGTQLCWLSYDATAEDWSTVTGALCRGPDLSWSFPADFSATPAVFGSVAGPAAGIYGVLSRSIASTSCIVHGWSAAALDSTTEKSMSLFATGRWF